MAAPALNEEQKEVAERAEQSLEVANDLAEAAALARDAYGFAKRILRMGTQDLSSAKVWMHRGDMAIKKVRSHLETLEEE